MFFKIGNNNHIRLNQYEHFKNAFIQNCFCALKC